MIVLLLGLKGAMSEAELYILRARLNGGIRNKAARGGAPARPAGRIDLGRRRWRSQIASRRSRPDLDRLDLRSLRRDRFGAAGLAVVPVGRDCACRCRWSRRSEILWVDASYHAIHQVLSDPVYAGAYTSDGHARRRRSTDRRAKKRMRHLPRSGW